MRTKDVTSESYCLPFPLWLAARYPRAWLASWIAFAIATGLGCITLWATG
jgi:hypothetical protein